jgi:hypothetical protein
MFVCVCVQIHVYTYLQEAADDDDKERWETYGELVTQNSKSYYEYCDTEIPMWQWAQTVLMWPT